MAGKGKKQKLKSSSIPLAGGERLVGWAAIAAFLGQTTAVAQRWHASGMPVQRDGRKVSAAPQELTRWVGTESGATKPIHISDEQENLLADLKEGLAFVRKTSNKNKDKK